MKRLIETEELTGLESMIGDTVLLICSAYFYHGTLTGVSDTEVELSDAGIVYETGPWDEEGFTDKQSLPNTVYVKLQAVESYVRM